MKTPTTLVELVPPYGQPHLRLIQARPEAPVPRAVRAARRVRTRIHVPRVRLRAFVH